MILEYIDRADLWKEWRLATKTNLPQQAQIGIFACPSNSDAEAMTCSYLVNAGLPDSLQAQNTPYNDSIATGLCHFRYNNSSPVIVKGTDIKDGAAQTILLSEGVQAASWDPRLTPPNEGTTGIVWWPVAKSPAPFSVLKDAATYGAPSSAHGGVIQVVFADGHGDTIKTDLDYPVYQQMMTPDDAKCRSLSILP
jgi:prepilin-type processing-associated H-X9-DG protein